MRSSAKWARAAAFLIVERVGASEAETLMHDLRQVQGAGATVGKTLERVAREVYALRVGREMAAKGEGERQA